MNKHIPLAFGVLLVAKISALGADGVIDVELIDRVELIRGPSSSVYGSDAFFGVVNFHSYIKWPALPADASTPLVIGILGGDPFDGFLERSLTGKIVGGRAVEIRQLAGAVRRQGYRYGNRRATRALAACRGGVALFG